MNEKSELFENDIQSVQVSTEINPPAEMFIGEMKCFLCGKETLGLPLVSSGWRMIQIEDKQYYLCKQDLPSVFATIETWKRFYSRTIRKIWQKDFRRKLPNITIFVDRSTDQKKTQNLTESRTQHIKRVENLVAGSVENLLVDMFQQTLPTIMAAVEYVPQSKGTTEFTATGDCQVKELDYSIHLAINFNSFGGVRLEDLPEPEKTKAKQFLPLYQTLEVCVKQAVGLAFNEMERQNKENMRQQFAATVDQLTFIDGFLYKIILEYKFLFEVKEEKIFVAPENPHLN